MTHTEKDLAAIEEAIVKLQNGERIASVAYDNYTVHYAPVQLKELIALRDKIKRELQSSNSKRCRQIQITTSKGTDS